MIKHWEDRSGDTGRMFEARFMGRPTVKPEFLLALDKLPRTDFKTYRNNVYRLYKENYEDDPTAPSEGTYLRDLRIAVADALGVEGDQESSLRAYSALGTPIDLKFGTDGFIEYTDPKTGRTGIATIDTSLNGRKHAEKEDMKADFLIGALPDAVQEADAYLETLDKYGSKIASLLIKRTSHRDFPGEMRRAS